MNSLLVDRLKKFGQSIGFDELKITDTLRVDRFQQYSESMKQGFAADMLYLQDEQRMKTRQFPDLLLPGARSILVGAFSYDSSFEKKFSSDAKFGRFAWGQDYHKIVKTKLEQLAEWMRNQISEKFEYVIYVDTGPVLEKPLAERAGIGWVGKHSCIVHPLLGSFIVLGVLITTLEMEKDSPLTNRCGNCDRCVQACPTGALEKPFVVQADKCLAYHTLANKNLELPAQIVKHMNGWVAGCDLCQMVCPWNQRNRKAQIKEFDPLGHTHLSLTDLSKLTVETFLPMFEKTTLRTVGWKFLQRNARASIAE